MEIRINYRLYAKIKGRPLSHVLRGVCVTFWPLSLVLRFYYRLRFSSRWYDIINREGKRRFVTDALNLHKVEKTILAALNTDGIYIDAIEKILPQVNFGQVCLEAQRLLESPVLQKQIKNRKTRVGDKWYVLRSFGFEKNTELPEAVVDVFLNPRILNMINTHFGMYCRLNYIDLWHNLPISDDESSISSERWHRDHEDLRLIKLFLYISGVCLEDGPFCYLRGTHRTGEYGSVLPSNPGMSADQYSSETEIWRQIPLDRQVMGTGKPGTICLCDATGFHRGGRSRLNPRTVLVASYGSNAAVLPMRYLLPRSMNKAYLFCKVRYAATNFCLLDIL